MKSTTTARLAGAIMGAVAAASLLTAVPASADTPTRTTTRGPEGQTTFVDEAGRQLYANPAISGRYWDLLFANRAMGWPLGSSFDLRDNGSAQVFEAGSIYASPRSGAWDVRVPYIQGYAESRWENGSLGYPTGTPVGLRNGASFQPFQGGNVYYSDRTGARGVGGAIFVKYGQLGWEAGRLGLPTTSEVSLKGGAFNRFQGGQVYWSPAGGAHPVFGAIFDKWGQRGWEGGRLGYPTSDEFGPLKGGGFGQHFSSASSIYWSPATGARTVYGAIRDTYSKAGWEGGFLGYPTGDEFGALKGGGYGQHFQGGSVYWSPQAGGHTIRGALRDAWAAQGWEAGALGYPTSSEYSAANGSQVRQDFQNGSLVYTWATGKVTQG
jgi:uncharacterized protein with LGFP repeats